MDLYLYHITRVEAVDYDEYDSAVVAAPDSETARCMHPAGDRMIPHEFEEKFGSWTNNPANVQVEILGTAAVNITEPRVILASFNAG